MKTYLDAWLEEQKQLLTEHQLKLAKRYILWRYSKEEAIERAIAMFMLRFNKRYDYNFFSKDEINYQYYS